MTNPHNGARLRQSALEKLAVLAAKSPLSSGLSDLSRLQKKCQSERRQVKANGVHPRPDTSRVPMSLPELEALLALCKAAPLVSDENIGNQLLRQLCQYLPESRNQVIAPSPLLREFYPSPWEALTFELTSAILQLGVKYQNLRRKASAIVEDYLELWLRSAESVAADRYEGDEVDEEELGKVMILSFSLLGFLGAAAKHSSFWSLEQRQSLIVTVSQALSEKYVIAFEAALSVVRNYYGYRRFLKDWKRYAKSYATAGRPLGAMLLRQELIHLCVSLASLFMASPEMLAKQDVLDFLGKSKKLPLIEQNETTEGLVESLAGTAADGIKLLEEGADYLEVSSGWQRQLAAIVKAGALTCFLCCCIADEEIADPDLLLSWLEASIIDPAQLANDRLAKVIFQCMAILARLSPSIASGLGRSLPRIIVQSRLELHTASVASESLAAILKLLPQDAVITTMYSLSNIISASGGPDRAANNHLLADGNSSTQHKHHSLHTHHHGGSAISLASTDVEDPSTAYGSIVETIVAIALGSNDEKICALALSMLVQKVGRVSNLVDAKIVTEIAKLGVKSGQEELKTLLKLYNRLCLDSIVLDRTSMLDAVMNGRMILSDGIKRDSPLYETYLLHQLDTIVSKGDAHESHNRNIPDDELAAEEIAQMLPPLARFVASNDHSRHEDLEIEGLLALQRDAWFNAVVHGFSISTPLGIRHLEDLKILAQNSYPLVTDDRVNQQESDLELNTVLRRGKNPEHTVELKRQLIGLLPTCESAIRTLSHSETVYLTTANLIETLRASAGDCSKVWTYLLDPRLRSGDLGMCMTAIAVKVVDTYLAKSLSGHSQAFSAPFVAQQLVSAFEGCCHRNFRVQQVAAMCADLMIKKVPSALCEKSSLFALLELLTLMWISCLENETEEYEWKSCFTSKRGNVTINLSDDFAFRRSTLTKLHDSAKIWVMRVIDIAPMDIKGLLQTYLSDYEDDGAYGHISLGRSFAVEMGSVIPSTDQRLIGIEMQRGLEINAASDFVAQYTTRQEYRLVDGADDEHQEWLQNGSEADPLLRKKMFGRKLEDSVALLNELESRTLEHKRVPIGELRDGLRRAGALLCRAQTDQCALVHHLVGIPFAVFTKQAIKLGISLWMGVINENPRMESRILIEIVENWEITLQKRQGLFDVRLQHTDPFYVKQEFAPSDKQYITTRQRHAYNLIAPHFRLIQFLSSHFNATRLGSTHVQRAYYRLINSTLVILKATPGHPLAREAYFHVLLLGLRILQYSTELNACAQWTLRDKILSAALHWFCLPPRWSFGGNRLQIKAEAQLIVDIQAGLKRIAHLPQIGTQRKSLHAKQDLLVALLNNEHSRLTVWLYPRDSEKRHLFGSFHHALPSNATLSAYLKTAWAESPALAVHLASRFQIPGLVQEVRWLILNFPEKVLSEPDALEILLGSSFPNDISYQLKYLLFWAPVNPITAVTYFMPAYTHHPFIVQYAMRALESHSVDVTFFYVPQIVQTLRYDALGYVERYIIETGAISQLFAHQIIWNMKANAFKDEESQIPDPVKPTLDKVRDSLIGSFSKADTIFYEREFTFFDEVTDISGKLKPYIKKSKPEKKQKIEEELRKIKVEVGVYLPSNPDGVVVGIDRKSGKPLQSHAKAPYMATFRIRKEKDLIEDSDETKVPAIIDGDAASSHTYEMWQSAIFKVGDDCRQDVLALQMIAAFRGIFHNVGLDVFVYPYRVTATAPGCGVIDVLPNSISRDMLGREQVNGLYEYFVSKYGGEDSVRFQEARNNFVKSMAAYSVISYLLQMKDRHNGNIMIDDAGHILHIDFGFCFDIAPGGIRFERAPFKLTKEMVAVMGGSQSAQSFQWFEELTVKAFLASRQHCEHLAHVVQVMLDSGLPCFKPETIQHFKERFVLEKSEREAADFMKDMVNKAFVSYSTGVYDWFQLRTNGIPY